MAVVVLNDGSEEALELSKRLNLDLVAKPLGYHLSREPGGWVVRDPRQGSSFVLKVDLLGQLQKIGAQKINPKKDLLCRALGFKGEANHLVMDGTLGLGRDALHVLSAGAQVVGVEQNPVTFFLLNQSFEEAGDQLTGLHLLFGKTEDHLDDWAERIHGLYLDPMFENTKQKSAPKKGLAFLRDISDVDGNLPGIIETAIKLGVKRVVVKRPLKSENLYGKPNIVYSGKLIRYDVYTRS